MNKVVKNLDKNIEESILIDYGGGCGMLSYLAKELGFKKVIYNDIYEVSVKDCRIIAEHLDIDIDDFVHGNIEVLIDNISKKNIKPDMICSFDVLEHIYNLEDWFQSVVKIENPFSLLFMTAANTKNPFIVRRLKELHKKVEFVGVKKGQGWKKIDLSAPYFYERKKIIKEYHKSLTSIETRQLAYITRGFRKDDILKLIDEYKEGKVINYSINHPTNTCDPYTGNWAELLIDIDKFNLLLEKLDFEITFTNSYYGYSKNKTLNLPKYVLNLFIRILGKNNLLLSPTYTLEVRKN